MQHEKIFKRPDGSRVRIFVGLYVSTRQDESHVWSDGAMYYPKNGKKGKLEPSLLINEAAAHEIFETKLELWLKLKPTV